MKANSGDRSLQLNLPRLPFDNSPLIQRKRANCSFINKHKAYLRTRGRTIEDVYSLNRTRNSERSKHDFGQYDYNLSLINPTGSNIDLPPISNVNATNERWRKKRGLTHQKKQVDVWKPHVSRRYPDSKYNSVIDLERERVISGHLKPDDVNSKTLGKVLSRERLVPLLEVDNQVFPSDFYPDHYLSSRTSVHSFVM